jgi:hypothetical protein
MYAWRANLRGTNIGAGATGACCSSMRARLAGRGPSSASGGTAGISGRASDRSPVYKFTYNLGEASLFFHQAHPTGSLSSCQADNAFVGSGLCQ